MCDNGNSTRWVAATSRAACNGECFAFPLAITMRDTTQFAFLPPPFIDVCGRCRPAKASPPSSSRSCLPDPRQKPQPQKCTVPICKPGYGGLSCDVCTYSFYSPGGTLADPVRACRPCPPGAVTFAKGATSAADCVTSNTTCPEGYALIDASCTPCGTGAWSIGGYATTCKLCPDGQTTRDVASPGPGSCNYLSREGQRERVALRAPRVFVCVCCCCRRTPPAAGFLCGMLVPPPYPCPSPSSAPSHFAAPLSHNCSLSLPPFAPQLPQSSPTPTPTRSRSRGRSARRPTAATPPTAAPRSTSSSRQSRGPTTPSTTCATSASRAPWTSRR